MIGEAIFQVFRDNAINEGHIFALSIFSEKVVLICTVDKITPFNVSSKLSYGVMESLDTIDIVCTPKNKA